MTQEDKELLLQDLCARLPYGVKGNYLNEDGSLSDDELLRSITICPLSITKPNGMVITGELKPYLFPLSSMTEEQKEEYGKCYDIDLVNSVKNLYDRLDGKDVLNGYPLYNHIDWLNAHHFDYRGLIKKGLAIDATGLNIY